MLTRGLGEQDGIFKVFDPDMKEADLKLTLTVGINNGLTIQWYKIGNTNLGQGLLLNNGLYANPSVSSLSLMTPISSPTELKPNAKYFSIATNTHTLEDGVDVGDTVEISWMKGTICTVIGDSDIDFTNKNAFTVTDTTWVFNFPVVNILFRWNGATWEIN